MKTILVSDCCDVVLSSLNPKTKYSAYVRGFTKYGDGSALRSNFTTLGMYSTSIFFSSYVKHKKSMSIRGDTGVLIREGLASPLSYPSELTCNYSVFITSGLLLRL